MEGKSDINLLVVLDDVEVGSLILIGQALKGYRKYRFASPVVVDQEYIERSTDVFPIEFKEAKRRHELIFGDDPFAKLEIPKTDLRLQIERELKQSLLWLREMVIDDPGFTKAFVAKLAAAGKSMAAQVRGILMLQPETSEEIEKPAIEKVERLVGANFPAIRWLLGLKLQKSPPQKPEIMNLFPTLLKEVEHLVKYMDELEEFQA